MSFVIGEYETQLARQGIRVAVAWMDKWEHAEGCGGEMRLTRALNGEGELSPAKFICLKCGGEMDIYPAKGGGVQPMLKGFSRFKMKPDATDDGRWR